MADVIDHSLDGESRFTEIIAILSAGAILTTAVVSLRIFTRTVLLRTIGVDDAFIIAAQILAIGTAVAIGLEVRWGLGRHTWVQPEENYIPYMKAFYSSIVIYNVAMCLVKISILLQYRRIFAGILMQRITAFGLALIGAWAVMISFLLTLICVPVAAFWDDSVEGRCLSSLTVWYVMASFNLTTDLALFIMPLPVIRSLQLPRKQKYILTAIFGLGLLTCIISAIRIPTLKAADASKDPNWDNVNAAYWSFLEICTSILASSLPTLRPALAKVMPTVFAGSSQRTTGAVYNLGSNTLGGASSALRDATISKPESMRTLNKSDDDVELDWRDTGRPGYTGYDVTVTGGRDSHTNHRTSPSEGIQTTTVITQQVADD